MICYKDKAFCSRDCSNIYCTRNNKTIPNKIDLPVSYCSFNDCTDYIPDESKEKKNEN